jgi:hypothetical protein
MFDVGLSLLIGCCLVLFLFSVLYRYNFLFVHPYTPIPATKQWSYRDRSGVVELQGQEWSRTGNETGSPQRQGSNGNCSNTINQNGDC